MAYSPDPDRARHAAGRRPELFASLTEPYTHRRRSWLLHLLTGPFQDHDERVTYHHASRESEAKTAAGIRANKPWNGNGAPTQAVWNGGND